MVKFPLWRKCNSLIKLTPSLMCHHLNWNRMFSYWHIITVNYWIRCKKNKIEIGKAIMTVNIVLWMRIIWCSTGFTAFLTMEHDVYVPPGPKWYCPVVNLLNFSCFLCSTSFILSMTFDRFYSIIMPHKAASFNTVKKLRLL